MQIKKKGQEGFTLIELLVVVVIIGILASVAVPNFMGAQDKAKNSGVQSNVHNVQMALEQYGVDNAGAYPTTSDGLVGPVIGAATGYLTAYPKSPWNTQQAADIDATPSVAVNTNIGAGTATNPITTNNHYGAISYEIGSNATANEQYDLCGVGKRGNQALHVLWVKNY